MKGYQVIGHYKTLKKENISSTTISDGCMFIKKNDAIRYATEQMHPGARVKEWDAQTRGYMIPCDFWAWRCIRVVFENGDSLITEINGTLESIEKYYIGQKFDMGSFPVELMVRVTCINIDPIRGTYTGK